MSLPIPIMPSITPFSERIDRLHRLIASADRILIGAGAFFFLRKRKPEEEQQQVLEDAPIDVTPNDKN